MNERHFFRCAECCRVFAAEGPRDACTWNGRIIHECPRWARDLRCDCGCARLHWMGRVEADALVRVEDRCACDDRCTSARGPKCSCACGGANHGTNAVVRVKLVNDIPTIDADDSLPARLAAVAKWREAKAAVAAQLAADADMQQRLAGVFIASTKFDRLVSIQSAIRKADKLATMAGKMRALAKASAMLQVPA